MVTAEAGRSLCPSAAGSGAEEGSGKASQEPTFEVRRWGDQEDWRNMKWGRAWAGMTGEGARPCQAWWDMLMLLDLILDRSLNAIY